MVTDEEEKMDEEIVLGVRLNSQLSRRLRKIVAAYYSDRAKTVRRLIDEEHERIFGQEAK